MDNPDHPLDCSPNLCQRSNYYWKRESINITQHKPDNKRNHSKIFEKKKEGTVQVITKVIAMFCSDDTLDSSR